ncbi:MAG: 23S rRNA pseudouridine(1911/1915/1917) synthase RluD [Porticoccaceae bacterium]|nr:23S rRNA pseudouridine(1911/1915/1917) synthase RluD [Porticoccaceae bacterium]
MQDNQIDLRATVPVDCVGQRIDQVAAQMFPDFSRSRLQQWIREGQLTVDGRQRRARDKVMGGEQLALQTLLDEQGDWQSEAIPLDVVYRDDDILVINKPVGLVVHPGAGNREGTLLNALLHHFPGQELLPRAGIVHRLDKDTSGLMVVARTLRAQGDLVAQLQARTVSREYQAVIQGEMISGGTIDAAIGRHPKVRTRMAVVRSGGKPAVTHYRILQRFNGFTHIGVKLETGRTHQIRVHMAHLGFPLVGDTVYGGRLKFPRGASEPIRAFLRQFRRQALHAVALSLVHPVSGESLSWSAPLPQDFEALLAALASG